MYVIFNAADVVEESYLALVSQESEVATGLAAVTQNLSSSSQQPPLPPTLPYPPTRPQPNGAPPPVYHDTRPEQQRAQAGLIFGHFSRDPHLDNVARQQGYSWSTC